MGVLVVGIRLFCALVSKRLYQKEVFFTSRFTYNSFFHLGTKKKPCLTLNRASVIPELTLASWHCRSLCLDELVPFSNLIIAELAEECYENYLQGNNLPSPAMYSLLSEDAVTQILSSTWDRHHQEEVPKQDLELFVAWAPLLLWPPKVQILTMLLVFLQLTKFTSVYILQHSCIFHKTPWRAIPLQGL